MAEDADVIVVGGGLAGLVAATEIADAGKRVIVVDQEGEQSLGGQAFWSFGGLFLVDSPEAAPARDQGQLRSRAAGLDGHRRLRSRRRSLAAPLGRGLCRVRRRRKTRLAARDGPSHLPGRRLGRARRLRCDGPRQFGAAVSCHLGHRPRHCRTVRAPRARGGNERPADFQVPPSRRCDCRSPTARSTASAARSSSRPMSRAARASSRKVVGDFTLRAQAVIVASGGIGGNHDLVRQNWPKRLGEPPKNMISGVPEHVDGRMIGITRGRRRAADQPRPDVALCRRHPELEADLAAPRHPHPAGTVVDVVRRHRQAAARAAVSRLRHARPAQLHHEHRLRLFVVRADPEHHQEGIRAVGLGAESRPHRQKLADDDQARHQQGRAGAGRSVQAARAPTSSCATILPTSSPR